MRRLICLGMMTFGFAGCDTPGEGSPCFDPPSLLCTANGEAYRCFCDAAGDGGVDDIPRSDCGDQGAATWQRVELDDAQCLLERGR